MAFSHDSLCPIIRRLRFCRAFTSTYFSVKTSRITAGCVARGANELSGEGGSGEGGGDFQPRLSATFIRQAAA